MSTTRPGDDPTPRAGEGGAYRKTPTQLATDPAFTNTYAQLHPTAYADPATLPSGTIAALPSGQPVSLTGTALISVSNGRFVHTNSGASNSAGYVQANLGARVTRIGCEAIWDTAGAGTVALVLPAAEWRAGGTGPLGPAGIHFTILGDGTWKVSYWDGSAEQVYASGLLDASMFDGQPRRVDVTLDGSTAWLHLPDGSVRQVTDSRISSAVSTWAVWELYEFSAGTAPAAMGSIWADVQPIAASRYVTPRALARAVAPARAVLPPLKTLNYYYTSSPHSSGSVAIANSSFRVVPWVVPNHVTLRRLAAEIVTAGETGSVYRLGLYADDGSGYPGALVIDAGTIAGDTTGMKELTVAVELDPGVYWVGGAAQSAPTTQPTVRTGNTWPPPIPIALNTSLPAANGTAAGHSMTASGALPATFTSAGLIGVYPRVIAKVE